MVTNEDGNPRLFGYARVSTRGQNLDMQRAALIEARCWRVFEEQRSGADSGRPERAALLAQLRPGDTVVVYRLDRWGRSMPDLVKTVEELGVHGIGFRVLNGAMPFDTSTADGKLVFRIFAALAEFIRELTVENTKAGVAAARQKGKRLGRPPALDAAKLEAARSLREAGWDNARIAEHLGVHPVTLRRHLGDAT